MREDATMIRRQELYCHGCGQYVQFDIDLSKNGNHVFKCPKCDHEHCRVVKDGRITGVRWDQRNIQTWNVTMSNITYSTSSTDGTGSGSYYGYSNATSTSAW